MTLDEVLKEARRLDEAIVVCIPGAAKAELWRKKRGFERAHFDRLLRVAEAAVSLFAALDYVTPGWREETCVISERSDEVNVAWCELEAALDGERERKGADLEF